MTRKDYILVAEAFRQSRPTNIDPTSKLQWDMDTRAVANVLKADNDRFNGEHFLQVCRGEKEIGSRPSRA
jgi:hypothetical protein